MTEQEIVQRIYALAISHFHCVEDEAMTRDYELPKHLVLVVDVSKLRAHFVGMATQMIATFHEEFFPKKRSRKGKEEAK